jgi:hypothetical protein
MNSLHRFLLLVLGLVIIHDVTGFLSPTVPRRQVVESIPKLSTQTVVGKSALQLSDKNTNEDDRLRALGYTEEEIRRSKKQSDPEEIKVRVDLVEDVDPFTLTAIGFALIALNFLVFANMGDGGIAGLVATIINTANQ